MQDILPWWYLDACSAPEIKMTTEYGNSLKTLLRTLCEIREILSRRVSLSPFDDHLISRPYASGPKTLLCHIVCAPLWATYLPYLPSAGRMLPANTVAQEQCELTPGLRETCLGNGRYPTRAIAVMLIPR